MGETTGLFGTVRHCEFCGKPLPDNYDKNFCPACLDYKLFHDVKDFIRSKNVNEYEVAEHFQIPLAKVKQWIRDGRIEYKETSNSDIIAGLHCQRCGAPVSFGTLCPKCLKLMNSNGKGYAVHKPVQGSNSDSMHYLDNSEQ